MRQDLLDRAVELRIKMQKAVQLAHVMPLVRSANAPPASDV